LVWVGKRYRNNDWLTGRVRVERVSMPVQHAVYHWEFGAVPPNMVVRQRCGNPLCVDRRHLILEPRS
jgi:hypothetical protein